MACSFEAWVWCLIGPGRMGKKTMKMRYREERMRKLGTQNGLTWRKLGAPSIRGSSFLFWQPACQI